MITAQWRKVKDWIAANQRDLLAAAAVFLVGLGSFGLGQLSVLVPEKKPIRFEEWTPLSKEMGFSGGEKKGDGVSDARYGTSEGTFVGSRSGKSYHYPWCPGAQQIKEENKIWFGTKEEAEKAGYKPALNCPDL
jgi:hypothetical protein